jgi:hypothetical protein
MKRSVSLHVVYELLLLEKLLVIYSKHPVVITQMHKKAVRINYVLLIDTFYFNQIIWSAGMVTSTNTTNPATTPPNAVKISHRVLRAKVINK